MGVSTVTVKGAQGGHDLRLSTRAMMALERKNGKSIAEVFTGLEGKDVSATKLCDLVEEIMNDGAGGTLEDAQSLMDDVSIPGVAQALEKVIASAFPDDKGDSPKGNRKRAG